MTDSHRHSPRPLRTPEYAAATWGCSASTFYRWVAKDKVRVHRVGRKLMVSDEEISRVLRTCEATPAPASIRRGTVPFA